MTPPEHSRDMRATHNGNFQESSGTDSRSRNRWLSLRPQTGDALRAPMSTKIHEFMRIGISKIHERGGLLADFRSASLSRLHRANRNIHVNAKFINS
jgi:hypothetical protein